MSESDTMFNEWDRRCTAVPIQVMTRPLLAPSKCKSGLPHITRMCPGWWKQSFQLWLWSLVWFQVKAHIMPPHIFEVGLKVNTKVYLDFLKSVVIPWCDQVAGGRPWVWQQDLAQAHKSKETQAWFQKECYDFVPFSHWPPRPLTWTRWTTLFGHTSRTSPQHQSQPDRRHPPSIHRAPTAACGKGMLPLLDPYRDGDWGCRRLCWIDVSSIT